MNKIYGLNETQYLYKDSKFLSDKIKTAIQYANIQHSGQIRKSLGKEPFIIHCLHVGDILAKIKASTETIVAGILHDVIEDTPIRKIDLRKKFGKKVSGLVNDVTEQDINADWLKRCRDYISHLKIAPREALCISAADKIDNMNSMTDSVSRNFNIFKNMVGTPEMHLAKFQGVYDVVKGKIPKELENIYLASMKKFIKTMKRFRYL